MIMFQIFLGILLLIFGVFLRQSNDRGFAASRRYWWMFVAIGLLSVIGQLLIMYQKGEL